MIPASWLKGASGYPYLVETFLPLRAVNPNLRSFVFYAHSCVASVYSLEMDAFPQKEGLE
jgi:hypothetical protein